LRSRRENPPFSALDRGIGFGIRRDDGPISLVADQPSSPLLAGVASFSGGTSSYRSDVTTVRPGATLVAHRNDGSSTPLVAVGPHGVALNFFPPSSDARSDFWDASTGGAQLLENALLYNMHATANAPSRGSAAGYCSVAGNMNGVTGAAIKPGTFLDLVYGQPATDPNYKGATPAIFVQGVGITCDNPPAGYVLSGLAGAAQGTIDGFYPYWKSPS
jgi:hypothetical protein